MQEVQVVLDGFRGQALLALALEVPRNVRRVDLVDRPLAEERHEMPAQVPSVVLDRGVLALEPSPEGMAIENPLAAEGTRRRSSRKRSRRCVGPTPAPRTELIAQPSARYTLNSAASSNFIGNWVSMPMGRFFHSG